MIVTLYIISDVAVYTYFTPSLIRFVLMLTSTDLLKVITYYAMYCKEIWRNGISH